MAQASLRAHVPQWSRTNQLCITTRDLAISYVATMTGGQDDWPTQSSKSIYQRMELGLLELT